MFLDVDRAMIKINRQIKYKYWKYSPKSPFEKVGIGG